MAGWITVGLGAVAAMCPLSPGTGAAVTADPETGAARVVVCAPDVWVEIGAEAQTPGPPEAPESPEPPEAPEVRTPPLPEAPPPPRTAPEIGRAHV